ncbi:TetR/AcrR family transcriptional regulator [Terricaulis silvestris]|uniref:Putative HTH-type transcriptional regulator YvdT n=1 Tax=Terricaulis silvestris TaxID=2686094 RepID=A0A6I6MGJ2_9CAUL|nr:TetR/AcrR family transcriptional regulator [Terricaulis silvestris]QGZ93760.1 putative HTH-type transcriptional regulator YvdT [Terricaulis silvestris]
MKDAAAKSAAPASRMRRARPAPKPTREEKAELLRETIFRAAADIVGELGYAEASIARITEQAGIAQGTFYLYFESRQALFDELLPHVGQDLVRYIHERVQGLKTYLAIEEEGFRAFFDFCRRNTGFVRVLNEAEMAAPAAHRAHFKIVLESYARSLRRSIAAGEIRKFSAKEVEALAYALMGARSYLYLGYIKYGDGNKKLPEDVVQTYLKLVRLALV